MALKKQRVKLTIITIKKLHSDYQNYCSQINESQKQKNIGKIFYPDLYAFGCSDLQIKQIAYQLFLGTLIQVECKPNYLMSF